jgi:hypothetical protein
VDVGPLVVQSAETSKLIEPRQTSARRPNATVPGRCHAAFDAAAAAGEYGALAAHVDWCVNRTPDRPARSQVDSAGVLVRPVTGGSHRPVAVLLASHAGWPRSGEPPAARPGRRKPDGACSRAWPDRSDSGRSGHPHGPRGSYNCPLPRATNQSGHSEQASPAAQSGSDPTRRPTANRVSAASTSSLIRNRVPAGASAKECRCEGRRQYRSSTRDLEPAAAHLLAVAVESARTVRQDPTTRLEAARRSYPSTLPRRRGSGFRRFCYTLLD